MKPSPYVKAPFPRKIFARFNRLAKKLGYKQRGQRWELMEFLIQDGEILTTHYRRKA